MNTTTPVTYREHLRHALTLTEKFSPEDVEKILTTSERFDAVMTITSGLDIKPRDTKSLTGAWEIVQAIADGNTWRDKKRTSVLKSPPAESEQNVTVAMEQTVRIPQGTILSTFEQQEFQAAEETIKRGFETFVEVGLAFERIRLRKLYREKYATFEEYCQAVWGVTSNRALQYRRAADIVLVLKANNCSVLPATESQARPMKGIKDEKELVETWKEVVETAPGGKITAKHVGDVVERRKPQKELNIITLPSALPPRSEPTWAGPVIDVTQSADSFDDTKTAIAAVRRMIDNLGTADSRAVAELPGALQALEKVQQHLLQKAARSKSAEVSLTTQAARQV